MLAELSTAVVEPHTQLRLLPCDQLNSKATSAVVRSSFLSLAELTRRSQWRPFSAPSEFCTIGVVAKSSSEVCSVKAGSKQWYIHLRLTDLNNALINVFVMVARKSSIPALTIVVGISVNDPSSLMQLGMSTDFIMCTAAIGHDRICQAVTDKRRGDYCAYHIVIGFKSSIGRRRMEFASNDSPFYIAQEGAPTKLSALQKRKSGDATYLLTGGYTITTYQRPQQHSSGTSTVHSKLNDKFIKNTISKNDNVGAQYLRVIRGIGTEQLGNGATNSLHQTPEYLAAQQQVLDINSKRSKKRSLSTSAQIIAPPPTRPRTLRKPVDESGDGDAELEFI